MKIMRYVLVVISIFLYFYFSTYHSPYYIRLADKITEKTAKELQEEKDLYLIGTGGRMMDDIQMMAMSFQYYQEVDLKTARELLIYATNKYLKKINSNQKIQPYLHEYPFSSKNVEIVIFIYNEDGSQLPIGKIDVISSEDEMLEYYSHSDFFKPIYKETYEEAVNLVHKENETPGFCQKTLQ